MRDTNKLGKIILKNLYKKGKNQKWLAMNVDVSAAAVSSIISGRSNPSQQTLKKISDTLKIDINELIKEMNI
jgi:transcriptional regulator with XRE-family HTH domain